MVRHGSQPRPVQARGLRVAAHLLERGETPLVLEAGSAVGASIRQWTHVRMFSPWRYTIDAASRRLLARVDWREPDGTELPTGGDLVTKYLEPLATRTALREHIHVNQRVTAITRLTTDKVRTNGRASRPFVVRATAPDGAQSEYLARAVIDATGTWDRPNSLGDGGLTTYDEKVLAEMTLWPYGMH